MYMPAEQWEQLADVLIFGNNKLEYLEFKVIAIQDSVVDGMRSAQKKRISQLQNNKEEFLKAKSHVK